MRQRIAIREASTWQEAWSVIKYQISFHSDQQPYAPVPLDAREGHWMYSYCHWESQFGHVAPVGLVTGRWLGKASLRSFSRSGYPSIGEERRPDPIERRKSSLSRRFRLWYTELRISHGGIWYLWLSFVDIITKMAGEAEIRHFADVVLSHQNVSGSQVAMDTLRTME